MEIMARISIKLVFIILLIVFTPFIMKFGRIIFIITTPLLYPLHALTYKYLYE